MLESGTPLATEDFQRDDAFFNALCCSCQRLLHHEVQELAGAGCICKWRAGKKSAELALHSHLCRGDERISSRLGRPCTAQL